MRRARRLLRGGATALLLAASIWAPIAEAARRGRATSWLSASSLTIPLRYQRLDTSPRLSGLQLRRQSREPTVRLHNRGHAYYGSLALGSQAQSLTFVFDTGSANLVVPSSSCESHGCQGGPGKHTFDVGASTSGAYVASNGGKTDRDDARHFSINFASGEAKECTELRTERAQAVAKEIWADDVVRECVGAASTLHNCLGDAPGILTIMKKLTKRLKENQNRYLIAVETEIIAIDKIRNYQERLGNLIASLLLSIFITLGNWIVFHAKDGSEISFTGTNAKQMV